MKPKFVEVNGAKYIEVLDDKPVFVSDDGKDIPFDVPSVMSKVTALNAEAKGHREAKEAALAKLKAFEGIEDAEAARKALDTIRNIDEGKLVAAGKVDEIKTAAQRAAEERVAAAAKAHADELAKTKGELDAITRAWHGEKISNAFASSKFISEKVIVPPDMMQATFGGAFKIEDGKLIAHDPTGNIIGSQVKFGEPAAFDEAIEKLVAAYPLRDNILKGTGNSGGGARPGAGGRGGKTMSRSEFDKLDSGAQMARMRDGYTLTD